jgi:predicted S18 family serine protease
MKVLKVIVNAILLLCLTMMVSIGCKDFDRRTQFNTTYTNRVVLDSNNTKSNTGEVHSDTLIVDFIGTVEDHSSTENSIESVKLVGISLEIDKVKSPAGANFNVLKDLEVFLKGKGMDEIKIGATDSIPSNISYFEIKVIPENDDFEDLVKTEEFTCRMTYTANSMVVDSSYVVKITPTYLVDTKKFGI